jgi:ABC-type transporter MlaC component
VHDIKLEGVSLLISQSSEFGTLAGSSGVKGVIDAMKKKIAN